VGPSPRWRSCRPAARSPARRRPSPPTKPKGSVRRHLLALCVTRPNRGRRIPPLESAPRSLESAEPLLSAPLISSSRWEARRLGLGRRAPRVALPRQRASMKSPRRSWGASYDRSWGYRLRWAGICAQAPTRRCRCATEIAYTTASPGVIDISGRKKIDPLNLAPAKSNGTPLRKSVDTVVATAGYAKSGDENDAVLGGAL
jgi:hypothetical protein